MVSNILRTVTSKVPFEKKKIYIYIFQNIILNIKEKKLWSQSLGKIAWINAPSNPKIES